MPETSKGQEPTINNGDQVSQDQTATEGQETEEEFDKERALATIRKLRESEKLAKQYAKELESLRGQLKQHEEAKLSETERLRQRVAELQGESKAKAITIQEKVTKYSVMLAAQKLGIVDPEAAYKLLDPSDIEYDDDGEPKNIEKLLRSMLEKRPYLAGGTGGSGNPTNPGGNKGSKLTMADIRKMTPEQINARWAEVQEAMKANQ